MDLDEMLRVDTCRDMDELINTFEPDPGLSPDAGTGFLSPIAYALQRGNVEFYYVGKIPSTYWYWGPSKQQRVVFRRRHTVVGGKCALPTALLVWYCIIHNSEEMMRKK